MHVTSEFPLNKGQLHANQKSEKFSSLMFSHFGLNKGMVASYSEFSIQCACVFATLLVIDGINLY